MKSQHFRARCRGDNDDLKNKVNALEYHSEPPLPPPPSKLVEMVHGGWFVSIGENLCELRQMVRSGVDTGLGPQALIAE